MDTGSSRELVVGTYLASIREKADISQAQLAQRVTFSTATISRIESGEKAATDEELAAMLQAIGTEQAQQLSEFISQDWDVLTRPPFDHPNRSDLWKANTTLRKIAELKRDTSLKAVFLREIDLYEGQLRQIVEYLTPRDHQLAFIGSIGVGKSTAICKLSNLLKSGEDKLDRQIVLETGAGGITLCEVHISQGPRYGLRIVPRSEDSIRRDVEDLCDYLIRTTRPVSLEQTIDTEEDGDPLGISKEVVRAIRNMANLTEKRKEENGKRIRIDPAKDLASQYDNATELCIEIMTRMNLLRRNRRDAWYPEGLAQSPSEWLQEIFSSVNNGRHPEFTLPQKIEVLVPYEIFANQDFPIRIIDTKGIDQTAERQDLECHFDDPRTLVVLCSRFNDAPEVSLQNLLARAKTSGIRDLAGKTILLVLPRPDEALAVKYDDGTHVEDDTEGYEIKRDQIHLRLNQHGLANISVEFFNARDEGGRTMQERFAEKIAETRGSRAAQIHRLSDQIDQLDKHREREGIRMVFEHVLSNLNTWIKENRDINLSEEGIQHPLIKAINETRHASTIRAAVRRQGDWYNLDYYHHLSHSVRVLGVKQIGKRIDELKTIAKYLIANEEYAPAKGFLESVLQQIDAALDDTYRGLQTFGREIFKLTLAEDGPFWEKCEGRWGGGPGYRSDIRDMTDEEFTTRLAAQVRKMIVKLLEGEWDDIVTLLEQLLGESEKSVEAA